MLSIRVNCLCLFCFSFICVKCKVIEEMSRIMVLIVGRFVVFIFCVVILFGVFISGYIVLNVGYSILLVMVLFDVFFN